MQRLVDAGATRIIVGTRALDEPDWLADLVDLFPGLIVVATDVRARRVVTRGWVRTLPSDIIDVVDGFSGLSLGGILVTSLPPRNVLDGLELSLLEDLAESSGVPIIVSGGVATMNDLRALAHRGVAGVVLGMALSTGALDPRAVAQEFGE